MRRRCRIGMSCMASILSISIEPQLGGIAALVPGEDQRGDAPGDRMEGYGLRLGERQRQLPGRNAVDSRRHLAPQGDRQCHAAAITPGPAPQVRPQTMDVRETVLRYPDAAAPDMGETDTLKLRKGLRDIGRRPRDDARLDVVRTED